MRVLCVGRHSFLSEHFCRYFSDLGAECVGTVGTAEVLSMADAFEPHLVVSDCDLLNATLLDNWSHDAILSDVPVLAVSLTRQPAEVFPDVTGAVVGVVYLPALGRKQALALLEGAYRPRGVQPPPSFIVGTPPQSVISL